jgi:hypothetical protein
MSISFLFELHPQHYPQTLLRGSKDLPRQRTKKITVWASILLQDWTHPGIVSVRRRLARSSFPDFDTRWREKEDAPPRLHKFGNPQLL